MYRFTYTTPNRSSGFDNSVIIHEYAHGISNRLTGGPSTGGCLSTAEAGGMGEGWSDVMALIVLAKSSDTATTKVTIGAYSAKSAHARDAIIAADASYYDGANKCEIIRAFAKRGLAPRPPAAAQMTFRFHLNVSSDGAPVSYDGISTAY
ncbi:hypothetical protein BASA60_008864 [Batrachochytrium salamandrivorans]|nr:hypothetical protein BASA60_008864 [Batrachochytrium salamandrivorans]